MDKSEVFISYDREDRRWVREFVKGLTGQGLNVWMDEKRIALGEPVAEKLEEALRSSDSLVLVLSPNSIESPTTYFELGAALGMGKRLIAIVSREVMREDLPGPIRLRRHLVMESPEETAREVVEALSDNGPRTDVAVASG